MTSPTAPGTTDVYSAADRAARVRFRRALALMVMTLIVPGSAQLAAGDRRIGRIALRIWLGALVAGGVVLLVSAGPPPVPLRPGLRHPAAGLLRLVLIAGAIGWAFLLVDAWRIGQPLSLSMRHRRAAIGVNGALCLFVASALLFGSHLVGVQRDLVQAMFGSGEASDSHHGRYNVLLLGGDSGAGRWGMRPDSMTVASIDEETGKTVLISLPRNMMNFPFAEGSVMEEQFPDGFDCDDCMLNGVSTWAGDNTELFPKSKHPGVDATIMAIEGITGLKINYCAMVNLRGFRELVDAVGGVTLNVRQAIPVGGLGSDVTGYIQPGVRKLDGFDTLWYARAREGSDDYSRMARQKCVMTAMLAPDQPADHAQELLRDRQGELGDGLDQHPGGRGRRVRRPRAQGQGPEGRHPVAGAAAGRQHRAPGHRADPARRRRGDRPQRGRPEEGRRRPGEEEEARRRTPAPPPVTGGSVGSLSDGYAANESEDLASAC